MNRSRQLLECFVLEFAAREPLHSRRSFRRERLLPRGLLTRASCCHTPKKKKKNRSIRKSVILASNRMRACLQSDIRDPTNDSVVAPHDHISQDVLAGLSPLLERIAVVIEALQARDAILKTRPVEAVDHFQLAAQVLLRQVVQHPRVDQALHERGAILRQP